ncbi:hypothetical protein ERJ75_000374100 [Trypanosoma vivax]|nr:hypothetical protein ERJ75_000374100 [Trypanosoma vivax]
MTEKRDNQQRGVQARLALVRRGWNGAQQQRSGREERGAQQCAQNRRAAPSVQQQGDRGFSRRRRVSGATCRWWGPQAGLPQRDLFRGGATGARAQVRLCRRQRNTTKRRRLARVTAYARLAARGRERKAHACFANKKMGAWKRARSVEEQRQTKRPRSEWERH